MADQPVSDNSDSQESPNAENALASSPEEIGSTTPEVDSGAEVEVPVSETASPASSESPAPSESPASPASPASSSNEATMEDTLLDAAEVVEEEPIVDEFDEDDFDDDFDDDFEEEIEGEYDLEDDKYGVEFTKEFGHLEDPEPKKKK